MKKVVLYITMGFILLLAAVFGAYTYIDGLASGWGPGRQAYTWNLIVHSYDELMSNKGNTAHLEYVFQTRLQASYKIKATVHFNTVTKKDTHITVTIMDVKVPEEATPENFDPEWHMKNAENRIDDTFLPLKNQSWSITLQQKEVIMNIIREQVPFIEKSDIIIIDNRGKSE